jgi:hypothetical protein
MADRFQIGELVRCNSLKTPLALLGTNPRNAGRSLGRLQRGEQYRRRIERVNAKLFQYPTPVVRKLFVDRLFLWVFRTAPRLFFSHATPPNGKDTIPKLSAARQTCTTGN